MKNRLLLLTCFYFLFSFGLKAQKQVIEGVITDEDGNPLSGAAIFFPEDSIKIPTDINGKFSIESDADYYVISHVGFHQDTIHKPFLKEVFLKSKSDYFYVDNILVKIDGELLGCNLVTIIAPKFLTPHSYTEVSSKDIQRIPTVTVQEMYNKTPGIYMHAGALNTNRMTIRGIGARSPFSTQKIRAFINDIPLTNGLGESNLEDINLGIVDNINIIKGPAAPEYGSALGGTILYETNRNIRQRNEYKGLFEYGSFNTFHSDINANFSKGKTVFSLNQDFISSDGYRDNNQVSRYNLSGFSSTVWDKDVLTVFVNYTNLVGEIPSSITLEDFETNPASAAANWEGVNGGEQYNQQMIGVNHSKEIKEKWRLSSSLFYNRLSSDERRPFNTALINSNNFGGRYVLRYGLNNQAVNVKAGVEYYQNNEQQDLFETIESGMGDAISENNERRILFNSFIIGQYPFRDFMFELGLSSNMIYYQLRSNIPTSVFQLNKFYGPLFLPHFSASYRPGYRQLYYFNLSQGYSAPSLQSSQAPEEFFNFELRREVGINAEIGTRHQFSNGFELDASIYAFLVNGLLIFENTGEDMFETRNAGSTWHPGLELMASKSWRINKQSIKISSSYQYTPHRFIRFANNETVVDGNLLPGVPVQKLFGGVSYSNRYFSTLIEHHFVGSTFADDENDIRVDPYHLTNWRIESNDLIELTKNKKKSFKMNLHFQLNNIFNMQYASMISVNPNVFGGNPPRYLYSGLPRNFTFGVSIRY